MKSKIIPNATLKIKVERKLSIYFCINEQIKLPKFSFKKHLVFHVVPVEKNCIIAAVSYYNVCKNIDSEKAVGWGGGGEGGA